MTKKISGFRRVAGIAGISLVAVSGITVGVVATEAPALASHSDNVSTSQKPIVVKHTSYTPVDTPVSFTLPQGGQGGRANADSQASRKIFHLVPNTTEIQGSDGKWDTTVEIDGGTVTITDSSTGEGTFFPNQGWTGQATIPYRVQNDNGETSQSNWVVNVGSEAPGKNPTPHYKKITGSVGDILESNPTFSSSKNEPANLPEGTTVSIDQTTNRGTLPNDVFTVDQNGNIHLESDEDHKDGDKLATLVTYTFPNGDTTIIAANFVLTKSETPAPTSTTTPIPTKTDDVPTGSATPLPSTSEVPSGTPSDNNTATPTDSPSSNPSDAATPHENPTPNPSETSSVGGDDVSVPTTPAKDTNVPADSSTNDTSANTTPSESGKVDSETNATGPAGKSDSDSPDIVESGGMVATTPKSSNAPSKTLKNAKGNETKPSSMTASNESRGQAAETGDTQILQIAGIVTVALTVIASAGIIVMRNRKKVN